MDPLAGSKTFRLVAMTIGVIFVLVVIGVAVQVIFDESVAGVIGAGIGGITGNALGGVTRNVIVDAPVRQAMAHQYISQYPGPPPVPRSPEVSS